MQTNLVRRIVVTTLLLLATLTTARAQLVADGTTATINGTSTNITGTLIIGTNGSFTTLIITNSGTVTNTSTALIGSAATAKTNQVTVTGTNSVWSNGASLNIGNLGSYNVLVVTNGGTVLNSGVGSVGSSSGSSNNVVIVTGANSLWANSGAELNIGLFGSFNRLVITNGGRVVNNGSFASIGKSSESSDNVVIVTGSNSVWMNSDNLRIGLLGSFNRLVVTNGGLVQSANGSIGYGPSNSNNIVEVTGANSVWTNSRVFVGDQGSFNQLIATNGGTAVAANALYVGFDPSSSNNVVTVAGGNVIVTNASANSVTAITRGTLVINSGLFRTDRLLLTNGLSVLAFSGGTLQTRITTNNNGSSFIVGNGTSSATFELLGNGTHRFFNGLQIANNALLRGNGTIVGNVTNSGNLSPGTSIGKLTVNGNLVLSAGSTNIFELNKTLGTNDNITGLTAVTYGGKLQLSNLSGSLAFGDSFKLFDAGSYIGSFSEMVPSTPGTGLLWYTNDLATSGTLRIGSTTSTWDGGGATALWSNPTNWVGDMVPTYGNDLVFPASAAQFTNVNDMPNAMGAYFNGLSFTGSTAGYTINGNPIELFGIITATGAVTHTYSSNIFLALPDDPPTNTVVISVDTGTTLAIGNLEVFDLNPGYLVVGGGGVLDLVGDFKSSYGMKRLGTGTTILRGANLGFEADAIIYDGSVKLLNSSALGTVGGPDFSTLVTNTGLLELLGNITVPENLTFSGGSQTAILQNTSGTNVWSGAINLAGNDTSAQITVAANQLAISGTLSNGGFTKSGSAPLVLTGNNTHTGTTRVSQGSLIVNGSQSNSPIVLDSGSSVLLGGTGIVGTVTASGVSTISPGLSTGILICSNLTLSSGTTNMFELNGYTAVSGYDQIGVRGTVDLGNSVLNIALGFNPVRDTVFTILTNDGADAIVGTFAGLPNGSTFTVGEHTFKIYYGLSGNDINLQDVTPAVWDGGGVNDLWSSHTNWVGDIPPGGGYLTFPDGAARLTNINNLAAGTLFDSITLIGSSNGYSISGNQIELVGSFCSVTATGTVTHTFAPELYFGSLISVFADGPLPNNISAAAGTTLKMGSLIIADTSADALRVGGAGIVDFTDRIIGSSGVVITNSGTTILRNYIGPDGTFRILGGNVKVMTNNAFGVAALPFGYTIVTNNATVELLGTLTIPEPLTISGGAQTATLQNTSGTNVWTGAISLKGTDASTQIKVVTNQLTISGTLSNGGFTKTGSAPLVLTGNNVHTNTTRVSEGALVVNGSQSKSPVILDSGASVLLGGSGTVGTVTASGICTISPGASTGILTCSNLTLTASTTNTFELNGPALGTDYDQLSVKGTVNLAGSVLNVVSGYTPTNGTTFVILANDGADAITGTFSGLSEGSTFTNNSHVFQISYFGGSGNDVVLTSTIAFIHINQLRQLGADKQDIELTFDSLQDAKYLAQASTDLFAWQNVKTNIIGLPNSTTTVITNAGLPVGRYFRLGVDNTP